MMSLFSSFDPKLFHFWFSLFVLFFIIFTNNFYKFKMINFFFNFFAKFLEVFFQSTKTKSYSKGFKLVLLSLVIFLFTLNLISLFSYTFTPTAQVSVVLFMALTFWLSLFMFYSLKNFKSFSLHFIPEGSPIGLIMILFLIEIISSFIRPITLTVRLSANIIAGHIIMSLLFKLVNVLPSSFIFQLIINLAEFLVCFVQAWIFSTLIALYYSEIQ